MNVKVSNAGRGQLWECECDAVRWLITLGHWPNAKKQDVIYVRRSSKKLYDLLVWNEPIRPGAAWEANNGPGDALVSLCLAEFKERGDLKAKDRRGYSAFVSVVSLAQKKKKPRPLRQGMPIALLSGRRYIGECFFRRGEDEHEGSISSLVFQPGKVVIQGVEKLKDGSHCSFEGHLLWENGTYVGRIICTPRQNSDKQWEADVCMKFDLSDGSLIQGEGTWTESSIENPVIEWQFEVHVTLPVMA